MTWCYRVFKKTQDCELEPEYYEIHEYYTKPEGWTENPSTPIGGTVEELREVLCKMIRATYEPVIEEENEQ